MPDKTIQVGFRLPLALVKRMDAYARRLREEQPWSRATRADAARALLTYALDRLEKADTGTGARKPRTNDTRK